MSLLIVVGALLFLMLVAYRGYSVILFAPVAALGAVLLIQGFFAQNKIELDPKSIAIWAVPTAIAAFVIHSLRIALMQRRLARKARDAAD